MIFVVDVFVFEFVVVHDCLTHTNGMVIVLVDCYIHRDFYIPSIPQNRQMGTEKRSKVLLFAL